MKKVLIMLVTLSLTLCACGAHPRIPQSSGIPLPDDHLTGTPDVTESTESVPADTQAPAATEQTPEVPTTSAPEQTPAIPVTPTEPQTPTPTEPQTPSVTPKPNNVFINNTNIVFEENQLTIRPKYVYWNGDSLIAECFVINGLYEPVGDIRVNQLIFANETGTLVDGGFGLLEGASIGPRSYIVWTFGFHKDAVEQAGGDLNHLFCRFDVTYSH